MSVPITHPNVFSFPFACPVCKELLWLIQKKEQLLFYEANLSDFDYHLCSLIHQVAYSKQPVLQNLHTIKELCNTATSVEELKPWLPRLHMPLKSKKVQNWGWVLHKSMEKKRHRVDCWLLNGVHTTVWYEQDTEHLKPGMLLDLTLTKRHSHLQFRGRMPKLLQPELPKAYPSIWQIDFQSTTEARLELAIQQIIKKLSPSKNPIVACTPLQFATPYFKRRLGLLANSNSARSLDWQWLVGIEDVEMKLFSWPFEDSPISTINRGLKIANLTPV